MAGAEWVSELARRPDVASVLRGAGIALPVRLVHASEGKAARAAPVVALF